jgi:ADP-ribose pyrophosphatase YjhB (NUDIX family)
MAFPLHLSAIQKDPTKVTSRVALQGGDPSGSTLPLFFSELLDGPRRREEFLQELADTAGREGITQLSVRAVIPFAGQVLLLKRRAEDYLGDGVWELPNGTVEPGESLGEALARVVAQETGLNVVAVRSYLGSSDYASTSGPRPRIGAVHPQAALQFRQSQLKPPFPFPHRIHLSPQQRVLRVLRLHHRPQPRVRSAQPRGVIRQELIRHAPQAPTPAAPRPRFPKGMAVLPQNCRGAPSGLRTSETIEDDEGGPLCR